MLRASAADRAYWMSQRARVTLPAPLHSAGLMSSGSTFPQYRSKWRATGIPACDSRRGTQRLFRSIRSLSTQSSADLACVTFPTLTSRCVKRSGCSRREAALRSLSGIYPNAQWASGTVYAAIRAHGSLEVGLPAGPNFFLLSDPEQSTKALLTAGFVSPSCRQVPQVWRVSDPDEVFQSLVEGTVRAAATIRAQSPPAREAIRAAIRNAVAGYRCGDSYEVPMPATLATAVKP